MCQTVGMNLKLSALIPCCLLLLAGCSTKETVTTAGADLPVADRTGIVVRAVSTKPWLVTGGDLLLEVTLAETLDAGQLQVTVNGQDADAQPVAVSSNRRQWLLTDLPPGDSQLQASVGKVSKFLTLTNYPVSGPIISGLHQQPFYCRTSDFALVTGELYGPPMDENCFRNTRIDYVYWSDVERQFKPYTLTVDNLPPGDVATIASVDGEGGSGVTTEVDAGNGEADAEAMDDAVPYIVRVETGVVNRAIYEIAMLHHPADPAPDPWHPAAHWNGKLVYTHGGGCRGGWYQQGNTTGGVLRDGLLRQGYAVVSASLNVFGQNCNDLLAAETHIMVKERFIEHYGEPIYTIATGVSGGAYQSHQTADNYPGVFDGIIVGLSFPDVISATSFTVADSRLLHYYFNVLNPGAFSTEQQRAISGFAVHSSLANLARSAARLDPVFEPDIAMEEQGGELSLPVLASRRYHSSRADGIRATVYDHAVNVYGVVPGTGIARRPLDNVGVQYGLAAFNAGVISTSQFLHLNRHIGGFDRDLNHVPQRHRADAEAVKRAIESGRILSGGAGLAHTPIIDYRDYLDNNENGDIHMLVHQFSTRQRLLQANGHADNQIMLLGGRWGFSEQEPDLGQLFRAMDSWLLAIRADQSSVSTAEKVVRHRPATLVDACWDNRDEPRRKIEQHQTYSGNSLCNALYPAFPTPRHVAGAPLANHIVSCQLRPINAADYTTPLSDTELAELATIFPQGVCDWSRPDAVPARHQGVWKSFGPSPVNRLY